MAVPPALRYTMLRLTLFVAALALLIGLGARGFVLFVLAVLLSGVVSFFLLSGPRAAMSERLTARLARLNRRIDESTRAEDDDRPAAEDDDRPGGGQRNV